MLCMWIIGQSIFLFDVFDILHACIVQILLILICMCLDHNACISKQATRLPQTIRNALLCAVVQLSLPTVCTCQWGGESVQPEMDHGASKEKAERCHASRRWGNVNRVTVVLIIMAACCRGSGWGDFNYQSSLKPCVMPCKKYRGGRGKNPWHFLKIKRGVRAWSANSCAIWSNTATHCRDQIPSHLTVLCTGFRQNRAFFPFLCWLLGKICRIL